MWEMRLRIVVGTVLALVLVFLIVTTVAAMPDPFWPAWIQAVGTILAIGVAIFVPWKQQRNRAQERADDRRLRAHSLAIALYPELLELKPKIHRARGALEDVKGGWRYFQSLKSDQEPGSRTIDRLSIAVPPVLLENTQDMYLLGLKAGPEVQQVLTFVNQYNRMVWELISQVDEGWQPEEAEARAKTRGLETHLNAISARLDEAKEALEPIHDGQA